MKLGVYGSVVLNSEKVFWFFVDLSGANKFSMSNGRFDEDEGDFVSLTSCSSRAISLSAVGSGVKKQEYHKLTCAYFNYHGPRDDEFKVKVFETAQIWSFTVGMERSVRLHSTSAKIITNGAAS